MSDINYDELAGLEVVYEIYDDNNEKVVETYNATVVGCDPDIGVTVVERDNHDEYLVCLPGPSAPNFSLGWLDAKQFREEFDFIVEEIQKGVVTSKMVHETQYGGNPTGEGCPFGQ